jgi:hypothetical protein
MAFWLKQMELRNWEALLATRNAERLQAAEQLF